MVDGFKIVVPINEEILKNISGKINWEVTQKLRDGIFDDNVLRTQVKHRELYWSVKQSGKKILLIVRGSINKFKNGNNSKNMTVAEEVKAYKDLCDYIGVKPKDAQCVNLEIGFGINPSLPVYDILNNIILLGTHRPVKEIKNKKGTIISFLQDEFIVKLYDRGRYLKLKDNVMAFELRVLKSRILKNYGIYTLSNVNKTNLRKLSKMLLITWNKLLIFDPRIQVDKLEDVEQIFIYKHRIPIEWEKIVSSSTRQRRREKFNKTMSKHAPLPIKEEVLQKIKKEIKLQLAS